MSLEIIIVLKTNYKNNKKYFQQDFIFPVTNIGEKTLLLEGDRADKFLLYVTEGI